MKSIILSVFIRVYLRLSAVNYSGNLILYNFILIWYCTIIDSYMSGFNWN